jgi:hypothetical protein
MADALRKLEWIWAIDQTMVVLEQTALGAANWRTSSKTGTGLIGSSEPIFPSSKTDP